MNDEAFAPRMAVGFIRFLGLINATLISFEMFAAKIRLGKHLMRKKVGIYYKAAAFGGSGADEEIGNHGNHERIMIGGKVAGASRASPSSGRLARL